MKFGNDLSSRIGRFLFGLLMLTFCLGLIGVALDEGKDFSEYGIFSVIISAALLLIFFYSKYETATGELTEEGVYVRHFLRKRFYAWSDIKQAGILWRNASKSSYLQLILVKPGGSLRKEGDEMFLWRNAFRLIHIPYSEQLLHYVISCYGPLDFDQRGM